MSAEDAGNKLSKEPESMTDKSSDQGVKPELKGLSVRQKVYIGFGGIILLVAANMGYTLYKLNDVEKIGKSVIEQRQPAANLFQHLIQDLNNATSLLNGYLLIIAQIKCQTDYEYNDNYRKQYDLFQR